MEKIQKKQVLEDKSLKVTDDKALERQKYNELLKKQLEEKEKKKLENKDKKNQINENGEEDFDSDEDNEGRDKYWHKSKASNQARTDCPYLSTIKRTLIDFDFEKLCSITLNNLNVYACLICSKYFQGRGKGTHAYIHSLDQGHHIFINLHNTKVYCLPENYEVEDPSLKDIKYNLKPKYTPELIKELEQNSVYCRALTGSKYLPGYVGLNNLKCTDYINVMIQALCRVKKFRDFFLMFDNSSVGLFDYKTLLTKRSSELMKKIWNNQNFKGNVSPHELIQAISLKSNKLFKIGQQKDTIQLFQWFFDNLQKELKIIPGTSNIIQECFQGEIEIQTFKPLQGQIGYEAAPEITTTKFLQLTLDVPPVPLYKEEQQAMVNVPIFQLLKKFDGMTTHDTHANRKTYRIKKLPKYLILHMKRFISNKFYMEKNPTIITFPLKNLDLGPYVDVDNEDDTNCVYNLLANICHEGQPKGGTFKIHVRNESTDEWMQIQDLHIQSILGQQVSLSESYVQIWERQEMGNQNTKN